MEIYKIVPLVPDAYGCAIVAASSTQEALQVIGDENPSYRENFISLYALLVEELSCSVKTPQVIINEIYFEN
jgi:hypothetical protein